MTTGWSQDQQGPRWPYADNDDTGPAGSGRGRLATETDPRLADAPMFGSDHPSGPLPVGPMLDPRERGRQQPGRQQSDRQQRGRLGRKSRGARDEFGPGPEGAGDADYDWIKYLGGRPALPRGRASVRALTWTVERHLRLPRQSGRPRQRAAEDRMSRVADVVAVARCPAATRRPPARRRQPAPVPPPPDR